MEKRTRGSAERLLLKNRSNLSNLVLEMLDYYHKNGTRELTDKEIIDWVYNIKKLE